MKVDRKAFVDTFGMVAESEAMISVVDKAIQIAPTDITVLLQGESGVGKDVLARAIHGLSRRKNENLVIVNCGAIPEGIIESELFGHEKGSFTGAHESREGYFEKADNGTIFLDEIGDTPKNVQVKLLRILENGEFFRVGSSKLRKTNVRIITATNRDLWKDVQNGNFREDLFYRLNTVTIRIPALRERQADIIPIFRRFVVDFSRQYDSVFQGFSDEARQLLVSYRWPGNIRELRNVAEQLVILEKSQFITPEILQKYLKGRQSLGSTDNLPIVYEHSDNIHSGNEHFRDSDHERNLLYRSIIDMRAEIADLKHMIGGFIYSQMGKSGSAKHLLPDRSTPHADIYNPEVIENSEFPHDHSFGTGTDIRRNTADNEGFHRDIPVDVDTDEDIENENVLGSDQIPSLEEAEIYLIKKALRQFDGNRRKVSEALGVSERTLYRKIDQYNLNG